MTEERCREEYTVEVRNWGNDPKRWGEIGSGGNSFYLKGVFGQRSAEMVRNTMKYG